MDVTVGAGGRGMGITETYAGYGERSGGFGWQSSFSTPTTTIEAGGGNFGGGPYCRGGPTGKTYPGFTDAQFDGLPIGGVIATDINHGDNGGAISPGAVGFDINCGVRVLALDATIDDIPNIKKLGGRIAGRIPAGASGKGGLAKLGGPNGFPGLKKFFEKFPIKKTVSEFT